MLRRPLRHHPAGRRGRAGRGQAGPAPRRCAGRGRPGDADPLGPGESTLVDGTPASGSYALLSLQADGITVDGFTIADNTAGDVGGAGILTGDTHSGYVITGNIITNNSIGLYLAASGAQPTTISGNLFVDNNKPQTAGGHAIYGQGVIRDVTVSANTFRDDEETLVIDSLDAGGFHFTANETVGEAAPVFAGVDGLDISGNRVPRRGEPRHLPVRRQPQRDDRAQHDHRQADRRDPHPPLPRPALHRQRGHLDHREHDHRQRGQRDPDPGGQRPRATSRSARNRIVDNGHNGHCVPHATPDEDASPCGLLSDDDDAHVDARFNWWGCNTGPGGPGCGDVEGNSGALTRFTPWLTLTLASSSDTLGAGDSTTLTASAAGTSDGGTAAGPFFDSGTTVFDTPVGGSFTARSVPLDANLSSTTTYTAGATATRLVSATLDNETQRLTFPDPPASDLQPGHRPRRRHRHTRGDRHDHRRHRQHRQPARGRHPHLCHAAAGARRRQAGLHGDRRAGAGP